MERNGKLIRVRVITIICILYMSIIQAPAVSAETGIYNNRAGPKVDKVVFAFNPQGDIECLLNDEVEVIPNILDNYLESNADDVELLEQTEGIECVRIPKNGYGAMLINCAKYPLNITSFRQAIAIAIDKEEIASEILNGLAQPLDSCVPMYNPFNIEGILPENYYDSNIPLAEQLLDDAGFIDCDEDGLREAPDGSDFDIVLNTTSFGWIAIEIQNHFYETLLTLGINSSVVVQDFYEYFPPLHYFPLGDFDLTFYSYSFQDLNLEWLAHYYTGDGLTPYSNPSHFQNESYSQWMTQLLSGTTYDDVYEAATEMQKIWITECPMIICYDLDEVSAYRTELFENFIDHKYEGVYNWWTAYAARLKEEEGGPYGGTLRFSCKSLQSLNPLIDYTPIKVVSDLMYSSLIVTNAEGIDEPWIAKRWSVEYHSDNPDVESGTTRIEFEIFDNVMWSDNSQLTSSDIVDTINYYKNHPEIPILSELSQNVSVVSITDTKLRIEFLTESYWHLQRICYLPILPTSLIQILGNDWDTWDPNPPVEHIVSSGPFNVSDFVVGEFLELSIREFFLTPCSCDSWLPYIPLDEDYPPDIQYIEGSIGNIITWQVSCTIPYKYKIYNNATLLVDDYWDGDSVSVNVDGLSIGIYNFTIVTSNAHFLTFTDAVIVRVVDVNSTPDADVNSTPDADVDSTPDVDVNSTPDADVNDLIMQVIGIVSVIGVILVVVFLGIQRRE